MKLLTTTLKEVESGTLDTVREEVAGVVAVLFDHLLSELPEGVFFFEDEVHDGEVGSKLRHHHALLVHHWYHFHPSWYHRRRWYHDYQRDQHPGAKGDQSTDGDHLILIRRLLTLSCYIDVYIYIY